MRRALLVIFGLAILVWALTDVYQRRWLTDDAFIPFRYAKNLVEGRGLVYNAGERVEGYTDFLWTLLLAGGLKFGIRPETSSMVLGIFSYALTLLLLAGMYWYESRKVEGLIFPVAFIGAAFHQHLRIFATSGLETSLFTFLVTLASLCPIFSQRPAHWLLTGIVASLAALTRPEGFLIYGLIILFALYFVGEKKFDKIVALVIPLAGILVPYLVWKYVYYGNLLPNTFYAKSANLSWWSQGIFYLYVYFRSYWPLIFGWIGLLILPKRMSILLFAICTLYLLYVARVGGDFMFARFCLPVTPLLLLGLEFASYRIGRLQPFVAALLSVGILFPAFPPGLGLHQERLSGIADEHRAYPLAFVRKSEQIGNCLKEITKNTDTRVVIRGMQAMLAYYGEFPVVIEGGTGLTDRTLAKMPITKRGRVGHEKEISWGEIYEREINFGLTMHFPEPQKNQQLEIIDFGCFRAQIYVYKADLMRTLKARGAKFLDFEEFLDSYIANMDQLPADRVRDDYLRFKKYYFNHNEDPRRETPFLNKLGLS